MIFLAFFAIIGVDTALFAVITQKPEKVRRHSNINVQNEGHYYEYYELIEHSLYEFL